MRRLEPAALAGVMTRDVVLFKRYWKATTFSSIVQPTIYLLAFGLGFGSLVHHVGHVKYVEYVATGVVATAVLFSSAFPGMFNTFIRWQFQRTYDALLAAPVDVEELVTAEILWISIRAGVYGLAPLIVGLAFGLTLDAGDAARAADRLRHRLRLRRLRRADRGGRQDDRQLQLRDQRGADADVPGGRDVLPDLHAARAGCGRSPSSTRCTTASRSCATSRSSTFATADFVHVAVLLVFALLMWRLAIWRLQSRLID